MSVVWPLVVTLVGENDAVTPDGRPEIEKLTGPENPPVGFRFMKSVTGNPPKQMMKQTGGVTVTLPEPAVRKKFDVVTVIVKVAVLFAPAGFV